MPIIIKVWSLFYFLLKSNFSNKDHILSVWDNAVLFLALYSAVCILINFVKASFPQKWLIYLFFSYSVIYDPWVDHRGPLSRIGWLMRTCRYVFWVLLAFQAAVFHLHGYSLALECSWAMEPGVRFTNKPTYIAVFLRPHARTATGLVQVSVACY